MPAVAEVRQHQPRHPDQAAHVRLQHDLLVGLGRVVERVAAEREAGVVDEHVDAAELLDRGRDEALGRGRIGDVELERDVRIDLVDPPRTAGDARALGLAAPATIAAPMPLDAPVTIAVLPSSFIARG